MLRHKVDNGIPLQNQGSTWFIGFSSCFMTSKEVFKVPLSFHDTGDQLNHAEGEDRKWKSAANLFRLYLKYTWLKPLNHGIFISWDMRSAGYAFNRGDACGNEVELPCKVSYLRCCEFHKKPHVLSIYMHLHGKFMEPSSWIFQPGVRCLFRVDVHPIHGSMVHKLRRRHE